jgi:hypothetical protein
VIVDGDPTDVGVGQSRRETEGGGGGGEHALGLFHDFGADAVTGEHGNAVVLHYEFRLFRGYGGTANVQNKAESWQG